MTIKDTILEVNRSAGSVFTREDVISILQSLELEECDTLEVPKKGKGKKGKKQEEVYTLTGSQVRELANFLTVHVESNIMAMDTEDFVDLQSADFELNGNEISLESVDFNSTSICEAATDEIEEAIEEFLDRAGSKRC